MIKKIKFAKLGELCLYVQVEILKVTTVCSVLFCGYWIPRGIVSKSFEPFGTASVNLEGEIPQGLALEYVGLVGVLNI